MRRAELLAGLGGLALIVSQFLEWYALDRDRASYFDIVSVGRTYGVADLLLVLLGLLALAVPVTSLLATGPAKPIATAVLASALGWIAIVLVANRLLTLDDEIDPGLGMWVALAGSILAWVGAWLSMRDESTPGARPPDVPRRPAPPARAA